MPVCDRYSSPGGIIEGETAPGSSFHENLVKENWFCSAASPLTRSQRTVHCLHVNVTSLHEGSLLEQTGGGNITVEEASGLCLGLIYRKSSDTDVTTAL